jgi:hypothetical protein
MYKRELHAEFVANDAKIIKSKAELNKELRWLGASDYLLDKFVEIYQGKDTYHPDAHLNMVPYTIIKNCIEYRKENATNILLEIIYQLSKENLDLKQVLYSNYICNMKPPYIVVGDKNE